MLDLLIKNVTLMDGRQCDLGIQSGYFKTITPASSKHHFSPSTPSLKAHKEIDAQFYLFSPPFVDAHFHLDSTLSLGQPRYNQTGTLLEGIQIWLEQKPSLDEETIYQRAYQLIQWAVARGTLAMRSHVDICDPSLKAVRVLKQLQKECSSYFTLQLVAFPQDGYLRDPNAEKQLQKALDLGVDVIGGIPHFERTYTEGRLSLEKLCRLAADQGLMMDIHCDETDDPQSRYVLDLASLSIQYGLQGRVTGSHLTSLHSVPNGAMQHLIGVLQEANLHVVANPLINLTLQGRIDSYPKRRGLTRVKELQDADLKVAFGHDCVMDPWYPLGSADLLDVASLGLHATHLTGLDQMRSCYEAITSHPAQILGVDFRIEEGAPANGVLLYARDPIEALRLKAQRGLVLSKGNVVAQSPQSTVCLTLPNQPANEVSFMEGPHYGFPKGKS